jgi:hypothetical protein
VINVTIAELAKTIPKTQVIDIIAFYIVNIVFINKKELLNVIMPKIWLN